MSDNELKEVVGELENDQVELGSDPSDDASTDWKAEAIKARGIAKRNATRLEKLKKLAGAKVENPGTDPIKKEIKQGFDYAEKAFLKSNGIQSDEYSFVQEVMAATGKSLDDVLESKYFQAELKERRDIKASKDAIPQGSKRSAPATRDTVEYWLQKGELPPKESGKLRSEVLQARIQKEQAKSQFADKSVV